MEKKNVNSNCKEVVLKYEKYEEPKVVTYTRDEILAELGPAQALNSGVDPGGMIG